jgi:hypothetical protein
LTTCRKSGGQEGKKFQEKWELPHRRRCRPAAGGRPLVAGRPWAADLRVAISGRQTSGDQRPGPDRWSPVSRQPEVAARRSVAQGQPATSGRPPAAGRYQRLWDSSNFFEIFLFKKKEFLEVWVMGQGF